ncbi:MAG: hypothetical protein IT182_06445 [Acidobacteria bacterium]|nr:hypothetical protein [Acidobacteriota bacterium]
MLRGNLSTRPFYNERVVQVALTALAVVLGLLTVFTVWQFLALSAQQQALSVEIARDEATAMRLRGEAQQVRASLDAKALESTVKAVREVNAVIDARTFSWTALFNAIERTIPSTVRLRSVAPKQDGGTLVVRLTVNAPGVEAVGQFMDRLEAAGAFLDIRSVEEQVLEDGTIDVVCEGEYLGSGARGTVAEDPAVDAAVPGAGAGDD